MMHTFISFDIDRLKWFLNDLKNGMSGFQHQVILATSNDF